MTTETKNKNVKLLGYAFSIGILVLSILLLLSLVAFADSQKENNLFAGILKAEMDFSKISIDNQMAERYYAEASYDYEDGNYKSLETNCRLAREYYLQESQGYKSIKAEIKSLGIKDNLIDIYVNTLDELIIISNSMFEACEHFESVARYYEIYYNTNVPYDDMSYDMGSREIEMMNDKIKEHDYAVERYNNLLEEFKVELKEKL